MYRFKRVESIRNVVLLAALRSSSLFNLQLYSLSMHDIPAKRVIASLGYCITISVLKLFNTSLWAVAIPQTAWAYWRQAILFDCETG